MSCWSNTSACSRWASPCASMMNPLSGRGRTASTMRSYDASEPDCCTISNSISVLRSQVDARRQVIAQVGLECFPVALPLGGLHQLRELVFRLVPPRVPERGDVDHHAPAEAHVRGVSEAGVGVVADPVLDEMFLQRRAHAE